MSELLEALEHTNPIFKDFVLDSLSRFKEVHLEQHSQCNAKCIMCPREGKQNLGVMPEFIFVECIAQLQVSPPPMIQFHLNGEPLLNSDLPKRIAFTKKHLPNTITMFFTNASLLTEEKSKELLDSGLDQICFSVDGGNKEDYEKIRVGLSWDVVLNNIKKFHELNVQTGRKVKTQAVIIPQKENRKSIDTFVKLFTDIGIDNVGGSGVNNIGGLLSVDNFVTDLQYNKGNINSPCWRIFNDLPVMANGKVILCCQNILGDNVIGDITKESLWDIWTGEKLNNIRAQFILGHKEFIPFCNKCDYMKSFIAPMWWL